MFHQPLFWVYLFLLSQIFVFITNRVSFHPSRSYPETLWGPPWSLFFISVLVLLSVFFLRDWDFTRAGLSVLSFNSKLFLELAVVWVLGIWMNHGYWAFFRLKPV